MSQFAILSSIESTLKRWAILLTKGLTFEDNFKGYEWEGEIPAGEEKRITHDLGVVPTRFLVTDARGATTISRSATKNPTDSFFYVQNTNSTDTFKGKILILP